MTPPIFDTTQVLAAPVLASIRASLGLLPVATAFAAAAKRASAAAGAGR